MTKSLINISPEVILNEVKGASNTPIRKYRFFLSSFTLFYFVQQCNSRREKNQYSKLFFLFTDSITAQQSSGLFLRFLASEGIFKAIENFSLAYWPPFPHQLLNGIQINNYRHSSGSLVRL